MNSREIVKRAIHYQKPSRMPVRSGLGVSDFAGMPIMAAAGFVPSEPGADEWGCRRETTHLRNMGQYVNHPLEDIRKLDSYPFPDFTDDSRYTGGEAAIAAAEKEGKYLMCGVFHILFERMHVLHGFENTLMDLYADRPAMEALADRIVDVQVTMVNEANRRFPGKVDGWLMTDDWGTQQAAFISLDLWMDFFLPRYKRIFDAIHAGGSDVVLHSCGKTTEIIEGFIQAGVDCANLFQPRVLGIEEVGRRYRGRIAFESGADIQVTIPSGDPRAVEADADALMTHWACSEGRLTMVDYMDESIGKQDRAFNLHMYKVYSAWSERVYGNPLPALPEEATK